MKSNSKHLLIFIDKMNGGGMARVTSILANGLIKKEYHVTIATNNVSFPISYYLSPQAKILPFYVPKKGIGVYAKLRMNCNYIILARKYIRQIKPDIIIAMHSICFIWAHIARIGLNVPLIAYDHTSFDRRGLPKLHAFIRMHLYGLANHLVILSHKEKQFLGNRYPNTTVINNPLPFPPLSHSVQRRKTILCAGRINIWEIKGFDIIINIWGQISTNYPEWTLEIAGTGDEKSIESINRLIKDAGVQHSVTLLGQITDMPQLLQRTSIFALPSRIEGMPMVLLEAMSQGCACIAFEVHGVVQEMLTHGKSGFIIPDGELTSFRLRLQELMDNNCIRSRFSTEAIKESNKFSQEKFITKWQQLLQKTLKK